MTREAAVTYYTGRSTLSGVPATLKWQDSTITLVTAPKDAATAPQVVFSAVATDITWMMVRGTALILRYQGKNYVVDMTTAKDRVKAGVLGGLAGGVAAESAKELSSPTGGSNLVDDWWVTQLQAAGVPLRRSKMPLFMLIFAVAVIIAVFLVSKSHN